MNWKKLGCQPKNAHATAMGKANPSKDTKPEVQLRAALHRLGYRFRKHYKVCDGGKRPPRVDFAFPGARLAVQVHGSFWHGRTRWRPKFNVEYWDAKFADNEARDRRVNRRLRRAGWRVVTVWDNWTLERQVAAVRRAYEKAGG